MVQKGVKKGVKKGGIFWGPKTPFCPKHACMGQKKGQKRGIFGVQKGGVLGGSRKKFDLGLKSMPPDKESIKRDSKGVQKGVKKRVKKSVFFGVQNPLLPKSAPEMGFEGPKRVKKGCFWKNTRLEIGQSEITLKSGLVLPCFLPQNCANTYYGPVYQKRG